MADGGGAGKYEGIAVVEYGAFGGGEWLDAGRHQRQVQGDAAQVGNAVAEGGVMGGVAGVEDGAVGECFHAEVSPVMVVANFNEDFTPVLEQHPILTVHPLSHHI